MLLDCFGEAFRLGSDMRARQFDVGNERCLFSFESQRPQPIARHLLRHGGMTIVLQHLLLRLSHYIEGKACTGTTTEGFCDVWKWKNSHVNEQKSLFRRLKKKTTKWTIEMNGAGDLTIILRATSYDLG